MSYKQKIKRVMMQIPMGESILLPTVKFVYRYIAHPQNFLSGIKKWAIEKREADYILKRIQADDFDEAIIVYDLKVSPPTYGDFFYVVMIARFFLTIGKKVRFYIINTEYREDTLAAYGHNGTDALLSRLLELPNVLLKNKNMQMTVTTLDNVLETIRKFAFVKSTMVVFQNKVIKRQSIYNHSYNLINRLVSSLDNQSLFKYLLNSYDFVGLPHLQYPDISYITWGARYSDKWGFQRNLTEQEIANIYKSLKNKFPHHEIMIVSDETGCDHFREVFQRLRLPCLFSKDFSKTFMGDCALVLGSDYYFQLRGGGIGLAPMFSILPYNIICYPVHERVWKKNGITVWAQKDQVWKTAAEGLPEVSPSVMK